MNTGLVFLLLFVAIPAGELYLMIQVGSEIGALSTVTLVLATAIVGGALFIFSARHEICLRLFSARGTLHAA